MTDLDTATADPAALDDSEPCVITDTHIYSPLPVHRWPEALPLILERVGSDAAIPSPDTATLLAARNLTTGAIDGVYFLDTVILADRFAANPGVGVSFTAFHDLVASLFGGSALYYTAVGTSERAQSAAARAQLSVYALLALPARLMGGGGGEDEDAVDSDCGSGDRRSGVVPVGEEGSEGRQTDQH